MVALLAYLDANGFANYIASGGGRDFMRPISQELYGVPRQRVIGSSTTLTWEPDEQGGRIVRKPEMDVLDDGRPSRCGSGAGSGAGRSWPPATPSATSRCCGSPAAPPARGWGCWCCTTTPSASSTTSPGPSAPLRRPTPRDGRWSASRTTGRPCSTAD